MEDQIHPDDRIALAEQIGPHLTRARAALRICSEVLNKWQAAVVVLDFEGVVQISPSFANALFLNLINACDQQEFDSRIRMEGASPHISEAIQRSLNAGVQGRLKLTSYLPASSQESPSP